MRTLPDFRCNRPFRPPAPRAALGLVLVVALGRAGSLAAGEIPLANWNVSSGKRGPLSTLGDAGSPGLFVPFAPCRVADTRAGLGFTGSYGPPSLGAGRRGR